MSENGNGENGNSDTARSAPSPAPRLKALYRDVVRPGLIDEFFLLEPLRGAPARQDRHQHGRRRRLDGP